MREQWINRAVVALGAMGLILLYGMVYTPHQDLSGSLLSGALARELGADFSRYSVYFPPAEKAWFAAASWLGSVTGMGGNLAAIMMTGAAVLVSAVFGTAIRRRTAGSAGTWFFAVSFLALLIVPIAYKNVFGLREHMIILGLWPWLVLRAAPVDAPELGRGLRVALGLWMGAMLTFKYLYAVVVMLVEVTDAIVRRRPLLLFRIENLVAGAVVAAYLGLWLGLDAENREAIGAMRSAISANLRSPEVTLILLRERAVVILIFLLAGILFRVDRRRLFIGLAVLLGVIAVAWAQGRWYSHHRFPIVLGFAAWWWLIGATWPKWAHLVAALMFLYVIQTEFGTTARYQERTAYLDRVLAAEGIELDGKRVGLLTQHPSPYNEVIAAEGGVRWTPFMNIAYVSAELDEIDTPENAGLAPPVRLDEPGRALLHDQLLRLWEDHPPDVLIFDRTHRWPLNHLEIDFRRVFSADPRFNAILDGYQLELDHRGRDLKFEYYVRAN